MRLIQMLKTLSIGGTALLVLACTTPAPETYDGLVLVPDTKFGAVYRRPGAGLQDFQAYGLVPCQVAFRKNWVRDQNTNRLDLGNRVTQQDVDRIRDRLGAECDKYFREALAQSPPYPLVENFDNGEAVLVLRPAIINLDIAAPDLKSSGMQRNYTTEAGQMTLLLEMLDGTTGELLVRIVDRQRDRESGRMQWTNAVTNQAAARRILKRWAQQLRAGLDQVTTPANSGDQE